MASPNIGKVHPQAYQAMLELNKQADTALRDTGLDPKLGELVKIRVSQINGCAFCLRMHTREALEMGESTDRLAVIAAWWESQYFTDTEQAALALAEQLTQLPTRPGHEADTGALNDEQVSAITWLIVAINSWNRIAISSHYPVAP